MSLEPIPPQNFTDYVAYSERKRTRWERFLDKIKPRSAAMRTTILVLLVVFFSLFMSLWFFWRTLYLPEIQQHARYLAVELELVNNPNIRIFHRDTEVDVDTWLRNQVGIEYITDPKEYPSVRDKVIAEFLPTKLNKNLQMKSAQKTLQFTSSLNLAHASGFKHQKCMAIGFVSL